MVKTIYHYPNILRLYSKEMSYLLLIMGLLSITSCSKFISVDPPKTQITGDVVFANDNTAISAITGIYSQMSGTSGNFFRGGNQGLSFIAGLSADELNSYSTSAMQKEFFNNAITKTNSTLSSYLWGEPYKYIFTVNSILEGLGKSVTITPNIKNQLEGEARFIRAFTYFYLVNLFGETPLVTSTAYSVNSVLPRASVSKIYDQVTEDLIIAKNLLPPDYSSYNMERVRPTKYAAAAMLARVYLYKADYSKAEQESSSIINNSALFSLVNTLDNVFLKNSNEAIWQLLPVVPGVNTQDGFNFILTASPTNAALSSNVLNCFETGDKRKAAWVNSITSSTGTFYYPFKYKVKSASTITEYSMILRLAEQFLIRAEARAQQNNVSGAISDINSIRQRAGLSSTLATDKASLLTAITHERQAELFTEWGHRWFDLKRMQLADSILSPLKFPNWQKTDMLYPIPQTEINNNPNLYQNPGY